MAGIYHSYGGAACRPSPGEAYLKPLEQVNDNSVTDVRLGKEHNSL